MERRSKQPDAAARLGIFWLFGDALLIVSTVAINSYRPSVCQVLYDRLRSRSNNLQ